LLARLENFLYAEYSAMFGFTIYNFGNEKGEFLFQGPHDSVKVGHAVAAVGYDDNRNIG